MNLGARDHRFSGFAVSNYVDETCGEEPTIVAQVKASMMNDSRGADGLFQINTELDAYILADSSFPSVKIFMTSNSTTPQQY